MRSALAVLLFLVLWHDFSLAIGDSGGGWDGCNAELYQAIASGTVDQIEEALDKDLASTYGLLGLPVRLFLKLPQARRSDWRTRTARRLLSDGPCPFRIHRPLDYAVRYGNLLATSYLLSQRVDPTAFNGKTTLYMRCDDKPPIANRPAFDIRANELRAYALTIASGGDVNFWSASGSAMHTCRSLEFLQFLVDHGARPNQAHLERAIDDALRYATHPANAQDAFSRIEFFLRFGLQPTDGFRMKLQRPNCGALRGHDTPICREVRSIFQIKAWSVE